MREKLTIARPYAQAAFQFAQDNGKIEYWSTALANLSTAVADPDLHRLIGHPKVSNEQLSSILFDVLGGELATPVGNFVQVLVDAERLDVAPEIAELFEWRKDESAGVASVEVTSAYTLEAHEQAKIAAAVRVRTGKECEVSVTIDQHLIGGAVIKIGDSVTDVSLRGRLELLSQELA